MHNAARRKIVIDQLLSKSGILKEVAKNEVWLARVLVTELMWGKGHIPNQQRPLFKLIARHKKKFLEVLPTLTNETNSKGNTSYFIFRSDLRLISLTEEVNII